MAAQLEVVTSGHILTGSTQAEFVRLTAKNGETLMHGEMVVDGPRAREAVINAMVEVLRSEGWSVTK